MVYLAAVYSKNRRCKKPTKQVQHGGTSRKELIGLNKGQFSMSEETKKSMRIHVFSYIGYSWIYLFMI